MRVSSGWSKGLKILTPDGFQTRPTRERIRQSAINMLGPWASGARVLDLFAGSGAVGIELASRGAAGAIFVENDPRALACLRQNVGEAQARGQKQAVLLSPWTIEPANAYVFIKSCGKGVFDLIWADPPYDIAADFMRECGACVAHALAFGGVFALESSANDEASLAAWGEQVGLKLLKQRRYGVTLISIWQKN